MKIEEAINIINAKFPDFKILSCMEYDTIFTFQIISKKVNISKGSTVLNNMVSINKETKNVKSFMPFDIPIKEYRNGKQITIN